MACFMFDKSTGTATVALNCAFFTFSRGTYDLLLRFRSRFGRVEKQRTSQATVQAQQSEQAVKILMNCSTRLKAAVREISLRSCFKDYLRWNGTDHTKYYWHVRKKKWKKSFLLSHSFFRIVWIFRDHKRVIISWIYMCCFPMCSRTTKIELTFLHTACVHWKTQGLLKIKRNLLDSWMTCKQTHWAPLIPVREIRGETISKKEAH